MSTTMTPKLTAKQQRFCEEYFVDLNATQAAIRAGYKPKLANRIATQNLGKPLIKAEIEKRQAQFSEKCGITAEKVLREYARIAFFDPRKAFDADGNPRNIHELDDDTVAAIAGMQVVSSTTEGADGTKTTTTRTSKMKFANKEGALNSLAKHLGIAKDASVNNFLAFKIYLGFNPNDV